MLQYVLGSSRNDCHEIRAVMLRVVDSAGVFCHRTENVSYVKSVNSIITR